MPIQRIKQGEIALYRLFTHSLVFIRLLFISFHHKNDWGRPKKGRIRERETRETRNYSSCACQSTRGAARSGHVSRDHQVQVHRHPVKTGDNYKFTIHFFNVMSVNLYLWQFRETLSNLFTTPPWRILDVRGAWPFCRCHPKQAGCRWPAEVVRRQNRSAWKGRPACRGGTCWSSRWRHRWS